MALTKILALLSLASALLLLAQALPFQHGSSRLRGSPVADLLLGALARLDGVSLLDFATRRNMVLLCHAILLVLLGDAGLLTTPSSRRCRQQSADATSGSATYYYSPLEQSRHARSDAIVWRPRGSSAAASLTKNGPCAAPSLTEPGHDELAAGYVSTNAKASVMVEKQGTCSIDDRHLVALTGELDPLAAVDRKTISSMDCARAVVADQQKNGRAEEEAAAGQGESAADERGDEGEDLEEMNRRFEAFIASTKEKMRLEALQPAHVSLGENRALLAR